MVSLFQAIILEIFQCPLWQNFLNGDERLTLRILRECVICTVSKDCQISMSSTVMVHYLKSELTLISLLVVLGTIINEAVMASKFKGLPFDMLNSFIVSKWKGEPIEDLENVEEAPPTNTTTTRPPYRTVA
ncbi:hypothetical protein LIER_36410 [Lithospermum erythrorhizon]|uniref:Uncharacterized protein n=1 Tax=Lithospermum erythrorhizon TaxID=34254 RepID=A0AAV3P5M2_LITER